jgi:integrase
VSRSFPRAAGVSGKRLPIDSCRLPHACDVLREIEQYEASAVPPLLSRRGARRARLFGFRIRWTCSLGPDHCNPIGDTKGQAREENHNRRAAVRRARQDGQHFCPRLERRRRKEFARVEYMRTRLGHVPVSAITAKDVEAMYEDLRSRRIGEGDAARPFAVTTNNRYMKLLHAVRRLGVRRGLLVTNPAASVELARENNGRNRCLSADEEAEGPTRVASTARGRRHAHRDAPRRAARAPVGRRGPCLRPAPHPPRQGGRWAVGHAELRGARANFKRYWQPVVKAAGLADFRFHDLRHTFALRLVAQGVSSYIVQARRRVEDQPA